MFATVINICVLLLLVHLKLKFVITAIGFLSDRGSFKRGLSTLALTFFDLEIFRTSAIACGILLWAITWDVQYLCE